MIRGTTLLALLLLVAGLGPRTAQAQATVALRVDSQQAYTNEPLTVQVEIVGFTRCEEPQFPQLPGCTVQSLGVTRQGMSLIGRTQSQSRTYSFQLIPTAPGRLVIPEVEVQVDGERLRTRPVVVTVNPSNAEELLTVEVTTDAERAYVGQRIKVQLTVWLKPAEAGGRVLSGRDMFQFIERDGFGPFPLPQRVVERARRTADGETTTYYTYETTADIVPGQPGPLTLDDVGIVVNYPKRFGRDFWGDLTVTGYRRLFGRPQAPELQVLPLPDQGRPDDFTGAVGRFGITVAAKPTTVRVGDPIELTIELRGDGELDTLAAPRLTANEALTAAFRVPDETLAGETRDGRRRFTQTIRAARADIREIPAIEYPYFDPAHGEYRVARSAPIPVQVEEAERLDPAALSSIAAPTAPENDADTAALDGLRGNETDPANVLRTVARPRAEAVMAVTLTPPALFLVGWVFHGVSQRRANDPARRRRQGAARGALARLSDARHLPPRNQAAAAAAALSGYLADRLDLPPASFVGRSAAAFLRERGADAGLADRWQAVLQRCESASYGAGANDAEFESLLQDARMCIEAAERLRL
jgi:hypothetical protein